MSRVYVINKKQLRLVGLGVLILIVLYSFWTWGGPADTVTSSSIQPRVIQMITGEFKSTMANGKEIEVYRWDPGTIIVNKGELVELRILGVNGDNHHFEIEGLNIHGEVKKGQETVVTFRIEKEGTYRIICSTHADLAHEGPMVGSIVVD